MANRGGQPGNQNASKSKPWTLAINRALEKRSRAAQREALDDLADKLLTLCDQGDLGALKELGDRIEGKPKQSLDVGTDDPDRGLVVRVQYGQPAPVVLPIPDAD